MIVYLFYNADLLDVLLSRRELAVAYVDDTAFAVVGESLKETHGSLLSMMTRTDGGDEWSAAHNSCFELKKFALMDFVPPRRRVTPHTFNYGGRDFAAK
ncbi:hypothetical protein BDV98DRAFT_554259 [Pterulicium gracile]|uniref:Reverse transcriptase domain-containing protein n=1 Tax=Pterulicium gracile TaxID=1884261 RepID=A0A5C3Q6N3_9AGAR|nr:hypothetical protein BDV98DRAFT_554259 [Pterula gracilis]